MTAIEEMAGMDVLCSDKTGTLTLNKLTVDKALIEVRIKEFNSMRDCSYCTLVPLVELWFSFFVCSC